MRLLLVVVALLSLVSCGRKQNLIFDQPSLPSGGEYQLAWVNPELIISDSLITLIRSDRIDSVFVPRLEASARVAASLAFQIVEPSCIASVELLDEHRNLVCPLLVRNLRAGHYKLTFQTDRFTGAGHRSATYFLRAKACGATITEAVVSD